MKDYKITPVDIKSDNSLFLIKKPQNLNAESLNLIREKCKSGKFIFSIERLFKGGKATLCIYGSRSQLLFFSDTLGLLELVDYVKHADLKNISIWSLNLKQGNTSPGIFSTNIIPLFVNEEVWVQIVLKPDEKADFVSSVKVACVCTDSIRRLKILESVSKNFIKIPQPFSPEQLLKGYSDRVLEQSISFKLSADNIYEAVSVSSVSSPSADVS